MPLDYSKLSGQQLISILTSPFAEVCYSFEGEDRLLLRLFQDQETGFYIDVGAHHPFFGSNTCIFHFRGWRGINIDATPGSMEPFRRHRPQDVNLECLVGTGTEPVPFVMFNEPALNSAKPGRSAELPAHYSVAETLTLTPRRLDDILDAHLPAGTAVDILSVDAEGCDLDVLQSNDFHRYRPRCIVVEDLGFRLDAPAESPVFRFLQEQGYRLHSKLDVSQIWCDTHNGPR